jgi:hypothetical protein
VGAVKVVRIRAPSQGIDASLCKNGAPSSGLACAYRVAGDAVTIAHRVPVVVLATYCPVACTPNLVAGARDLTSSSIPAARRGFALPRLVPSALRTFSSYTMNADYNFLIQFEVRCCAPSHHDHHLLRLCHSSYANAANCCSA